MKHSDEELATIRRDLNPTPAARVAMLVWGDAYSKQRGGSMQFWDSLPNDKKRLCEMVANNLVGSMTAALNTIKELADEDIRTGRAEKTFIYEIEARASSALGVVESIP